MKSDRMDWLELEKDPQLLNQAHFNSTLTLDQNPKHRMDLSAASLLLQALRYMPDSRVEFIDIWDSPLFPKIWAVANVPQPYNFTTETCKISGHNILYSWEARA